MSLRAALDLIIPALDALGLDDPDELQLCSARRLRGMHHPPLNPDVAALIPLGEGAPALPAIRQVLLNQYAADHPAILLHGPRGALQAARLTVGGLDGDDLDLPGQRAALVLPPLPQAGSFTRFLETIAHLRAPEGCPWDRKQTHTTLRPYLLEETYEVLEALDSGDVDALREELGDLLLQIVLHAQIAVDGGEFRMPDVIAAINAKIIRRHPHVWGQAKAHDEQDVKATWDRLKQAEKTVNGAVRRSRLDGVARALPALTQAVSYQDRAARVGFDWETVEPVIAKVHEEVAELLAAGDGASQAQEIGDLLFAVVNLARWLKIDPESALREANRRFYRRFAYIEQQAAAQGRALDTLSLAEMDALWDEAKTSGL